MKKTYRNLISLLILLGLSRSGAILAQDVSIQIGVHKSIPSEILLENRSFLIYLPDSYQTSASSYPVLYLLDGSDYGLFNTLSDLRRLQGRDLAPEMIIIAIENTDRNRDMMPVIAEGYPGPPRAEDFLSFIEKELIPSIEETYRTDGQRILKGQSLSGLFTLYALLTKPRLFDAYIGHSAGWFEESNDYFMDLSKKAFQKAADFDGRKIFMANSLNDPYDPDRVIHKQLADFSELIKNRLGERISYKYVTYADYTHVPFPGFYDAIKFIFEPEETRLAEDTDETAVKKLVESFLTAIGNGDLDDIEPMFLPRATIGGSSFRDGKWNTFTTTIEDYLASKKDKHVPYTEPVSNYTIHISEGQLAFVKADAILYREGKAQSHNMDYFTLLKENGTWKFLSAAYTAKPIIIK
ncbi:alpha/beta hydrolase-fold protein [Algoriphagus sp. D3-2-R+10]|uniref:alpha/beta hydrolase-fold protein n=1 Tax=Algoriphagus aurantiacus TaxID=3103948 RepID=UPI002B38B92A|nr:alpha/beta hydrolase-fold protein [Algoriphagus sp. D3-2-R+10]MEB2774183.1 alpha/beta hydrolase-fold protein [Algoriphagus sp. D3-2-R+10]